MRYQKLGEHVFQVRGISFKPDNIITTEKDGYVPVIRSNNITEEGFKETDLIYIKKEFIRQEQLIKGGDLVLTASSGSKKTIGKNIQFDCDFNGSFGAFCKLVRPKKSINSKYLYHFFKTRFFRNSIERIVQGANIANLKNEYIDDLQILLPPFDDQIRIATLLSKVENLITRRREQLKQLDELLKSVFLEMFGSIIKSGLFYAFGNYIDTLTDYHANGSYEILRNNVELQATSNYALMVRTTDLEHNNFADGCNYITREAYEFLCKSKVYGGEIIINKIGSAGKVYLMPDLKRPVSLGMNAFLIRTNGDMNNIYLYYLLTSDFGINAIQKRIKGAVTKTITKDAIRNIPIPVPNIDLQKQFVDIAEKVDNIKSRYQQSLTELENLYGVLSQKAFKGELDL